MELYGFSIPSCLLLFDIASLWFTSRVLIASTVKVFILLILTWRITALSLLLHHVQPPPSENLLALFFWGESCLPLECVLWRGVCSQRYLVYLQTKEHLLLYSWLLFCYALNKGKRSTYLLLLGVLSPNSGCRPFSAELHSRNNLIGL